MFATPAVAMAAPSASAAEMCHTVPAASSWDFFTNFGRYMPRTHCLTGVDGRPDWPWIAALIVLTSGVIVGYLRIFVFWRRSYAEEPPRDRNRKLMDLAWVFLWCAICGYAMSILMFVWPAYRLLAAFLVVLNIFTWKFIGSLDDFRVSFSAKRLQRELGEALERRNAELERLVAERTEELQSARAAADAANASKSTFLANMSHEIRTPMTAILGFADLLADPAQTPSDREACISTIRRQGDHLLNVINDILDLSKIEADKLVVESIPTPIAAVLDDVRASLTPRANAKGIELRFVAPRPLPAQILTDPTRLRQILINIVGNAIKFTPAGSITVTAVVEPEGFLRFDVADTGIGMNPDQVSRLFKPFSQADDSTTRKYGGTGLGLTISKRLARLLGGDIQVESTPDRGSTFTLTINPGNLADVPRVPWVPGASASRAAPPTTTHGVVLRGRILLAEDGPDNQRLIAHHLRRAGAAVVIADNGRVALDAVAAAEREGRPFDLIILDMQMPELDGYGAAAELRRRSITIPILALTAHAMNGDRERCLAAGCDEFASKPIDAQSLLETCAAMLRHATLPSNAA
jgi:signal transduction histidine kinase/ActR/RegA family two-component response regulator